MYNKKSLKLHITLIALGFFYNTPTHALNLQMYKPHSGFRNGYQLYTTEGIPNKSITLGRSFDYANTPFQVQEVTPTGQSVVNVIDDLLTTDFNISVAITPSLSLQAALPIHLYYNLPTPVNSTHKEGSFEFGDLRFAAQIRLIDTEANSSKWGLAIIPFLSLPTGNEELYMGEKSATAGGILAIEKRLQNLAIYLNTGLEFYESQKFLTINRDDQWTYGVGGQYFFTSQNPIALTIELFGSTTLATPFDQNDQLPLELISVIEKSWINNNQRRIQIHMGGGVGLSKGNYGSPDYRLIVGATISFPWEKPRKALQQTFYLDSGKTHISAADQQTLQNLVQTIQSKRIQTLEIKGYADYYGLPYQQNVKLSEERAHLLKTYFESVLTQSQEIKTDNEVIYNPDKSPALPMPEERKIEIYFYQ